EKAKKNLDHPQAAPLLLWVCTSGMYGGSDELRKLYTDTVDLLMERFVERKELAPLGSWLARDDNPAWAQKHLRRLMEKNPSADVKINAAFGLASLLKSEDEKSQAEAEKLFQHVIDEASKTPNQMHLADQAKKELDDSRLRGIGKPVPDIIGDDL